MSDITIEFRVKNARIKRAILKAWPSYIAFCRANHLPYGLVNDYLGMRKSPIGKDGWRESAMDLATALHLEPEELWPGDMARAQLNRNSGEFALTLEEAAALPRAGITIDRRALKDLTSILTPREMRALTGAVKGEPGDVTAKGLGIDGGDVGRMRAYQLRDKAVRRLRSKAYAAGIDLHDIVIRDGES